MLSLLLKEIRHNPLLWLLVFVPVVFAGENLTPDADTLLFVLSVLAIVPLAALLSHTTESVAVKTGDAVGGLLNASLRRVHRGGAGGRRGRDGLGVLQRAQEPAGPERGDRPLRRRDISRSCGSAL